MSWSRHMEIRVQYDVRRGEDVATCLGAARGDDCGYIRRTLLQSYWLDWLARVRLLDYSVITLVASWFEVRCPQSGRAIRLHLQSAACFSRCCLSLRPCYSSWARLLCRYGYVGAETF